MPLSSCPPSISSDRSRCRIVPCMRSRHASRRCDCTMPSAYVFITAPTAVSSCAQQVCGIVIAPLRCDAIRRAQLRSRGDADVDDDRWWRGAVIYQIYPRSFHGHRRRRRRRPARHHRAAGLRRQPGRRCDLDLAVLQVADGRLRLRRRRLPRRRPAVRHARRLRPPARRSAHALRPAGDDRPGAQPHLDRARWFRESRESRDNPKADWYVWADAKPDGTPPNNWLSIFGGAAWQWEPRRGQYYLHNFLSSQPDLNFHNPAVRAATLDNVRFWLDQGVDGFRLDAINFCFHDARAARQPAQAAGHCAPGAASARTIRTRSRTTTTTTRSPRTWTSWRQLRALLDRYPGATTLGEISSEDSLATMAEYTSDRPPAHGLQLRVAGRRFQRRATSAHGARRSKRGCSDGWPCWAFSNHDVQRAVTRWGNGQPATPPARRSSSRWSVRCAARSACTRARNWACRKPTCRSRRLQDPYGIAFWPTLQGPRRLPHADAVERWRRACRLQQRRSRGCRCPPRIATWHVAAQDADPHSALNLARRFLHWRKSLPALVEGDIRFLDAPEPLLVFVRSLGGRARAGGVQPVVATGRWALALDVTQHPITDHGLALRTHR